MLKRRTAKKFKLGISRKEKPKRKHHLRRETKGQRVDRKLRALGFGDYDGYMGSGAWREYRARYAAAYGPREIGCVACGLGRFEMHHLTYARVGRESLRDCIPLCKPCHVAVHRHHDRQHSPLFAFRAALRAIFGWSAEETRARLARYDRLPA